MDAELQRRGEHLLEEYRGWLEEQGRRYADRVLTQLAGVERETLYRAAVAALNETYSAAPDGPTSEYDWAERRAVVFDRHLREEGYITPSRWETLKQEAAARMEAAVRWFSSADPPATPAAEREAALQPDPDPPREGKLPILCRDGAVSLGDIIEPAPGAWFKVMELGEDREPPADHGGIRPYGTALEPGERWQTAYCRRATEAEIAAAKEAQLGLAAREAEWDVSVPGPKALAYITDITEHRELIDARVAAIEDPTTRARAERLLETIRREEPRRERAAQREAGAELEP